MAQQTALELKEKGNVCMKDGKYMEAIIHYTHALHSDPTNAQIYSNRSLAFFKEQQHFFAMEDAKSTIKLEPKWFKGHLRKADVEFACQRFADAVETCKAGLNHNPDQESLVECLAKSKRSLERQRTQQSRWPVIGIGTGVVVGIMIVFADELLTDGQPYLQNVLFKLLVVLFFGLLGKGGAALYKYIDDWAMDSNLSPPPDVLGDGTSFQNGFFPPPESPPEGPQQKDGKKKRSKKD